VTVTSQHSDLPLCHGTSVRPSGLFPSVRNNLDGSFVTGVPAEAKLRATRSLRAWCLAVLPGAFLPLYYLGKKNAAISPDLWFLGFILTFRRVGEG